jgi:imidazolonepropionase-like amidohydrolase
LQSLGLGFKTCETKQTKGKTMKHLLLAGLASMAFWSSSCFAQDSANPITAIKAGRLVDVIAGQVRSDQVILIQNGKIIQIGPVSSTAIPDDATLIDLSSATVTPGLIDTHTHITSDPYLGSWEGYGLSVPRLAITGAANARKMLMSGVTTLRDVGSIGFGDLAVRDAINAGEIEGPRILGSGPALGITGGHCDSNMLAPEYKERAEAVADGPDAVRAMVRRNVKYGVDVIKYCGTGGVFSKGTFPGAQQFTEEEVKALIDEAHMHQRRVAVHAHGAAGIKVALRQGVDTVEHASMIDDEGLKLAKEKGAFLSMDIYNTEFTQAFGKRNGVLEEFLQKDRDTAQVQRDNFGKAVRMGIKLTMGTDAGIYPHGDVGKHVSTMVDFGMTPMQALTAASLNGATALGIEAQTGSISVGKSADIIATKDNPIANIRAIESVGFVMRAGVVYKDQLTAK